MKINSPVTDENAVERFSDMLSDCADMFGRFPAATKKVDIDAWSHLLVYAPIEALRYIVSLKENKMTPRNPLDKKVIVDRELFRALYLLAKNASIGKLSDADAETCRELWNQELTGWAAVPVELTDDHIYVAWLNIDDDLESKTLRNVHRAMLEASPPLPTGEKQ